MVANVLFVMGVQGCYAFVGESRTMVCWPTVIVAVRHLEWFWYFVLLSGGAQCLVVVEWIGPSWVKRFSIWLLITTESKGVQDYLVMVVPIA